MGNEAIVKGLVEMRKYWDALEGDFRVEETGAEGLDSEKKGRTHLPNHGVYILASGLTALQILLPCVSCSSKAWTASHARLCRPLSPKPGAAVSQLCQGSFCNARLRIQDPAGHRP